MPGKGSGCAPSCCSTAISKSNLMWSTLAMISCMVAVAAAATPARLPLRSPAALTPLTAVGPAAQGPPPPRLAAAAAAAAARGMLGAPGARAGPFACPDSANQAQSTGRSASPASSSPNAHLKPCAPGVSDADCACARSSGTWRRVRGAAETRLGVTRGQDWG